MRRRKLMVIAVELVIIGILFVIIGCNVLKKDKKKSIGENPDKVMQEADKSRNEAQKDKAQKDNKKSEVTKAPTATPVPTLTPEEKAELERIAREEEERIAREKHEAEMAGVISQAKAFCTQYDYDKALSAILAVEGYENDEVLMAQYNEIQAQKDACVVWKDNTQISHLFVHSLIVDTSRAFGPGSSQPNGYNQYMTTVDEFNKILEQMYERGYVLVSVHDMAERVVGEDGVEKLVKKEILLPEGKIPFVLSQDDVNYYLYMDGDGFAERLVVGEDGLPTCEYIQKDGTAVYGEYDMVPIVDRFVREHPDFSYHGRKGILAVTGYEGALGYDTGLSMKIYDGLSEEEKMKRIEAEREKAIAVADALKADGWEFATHSYTHSDMKKATVDKLSYDLRRWHEEVEIILGKTDIYIYPYGADICEWMGYSGEKYELMKKYDFWYFCNVDSSTQYWVQIRDGYLRQGRINADGLLMQTRPQALEYFYDVKSVLDPSRPALK